MKVEDSGMPEEAYWNSLFDIEGIIEWLALSKKPTNIIEIGCGYGTFTVPLAKELKGHVSAFDIESSMIEVAHRNTRRAGLSNIAFGLRDVLDQGTGLEPDSVDMVLLFNILHCSDKRVFLEEASRVLKNGGIVAIIHWRKDISTPRGPAVNTRPDKAQILSASEGLSLNYQGNSGVLEPYHWGMQLVKGQGAQLIKE
jgi:ubiquinone/menaquinone biosynthesis C-methylase UbiE